MTTETNLKRPRFVSVKAAREALKEDAAEIIADFRKMIIMAAASGEYESALKAMQWLVDHIPSEDGTRVIDSSLDKQAAVPERPQGPMIQIGVRIGGTGQPELPPAVEVTTVDAE